MNWEETVMKDFSIQLDAFNFLCNLSKAEGTDSPTLEDLCKSIANKQAKITGDIAFKAGEQQGIKKVVEWIPQLIQKVKDAMWDDDWGVKGVIYPKQLDDIVSEAIQAFLTSKGIEK